MSRRSLFGAYSQHQPNMSKYSYPSDVSLSSHYGYTSWGLWRDTGHLSPSIHSKKRINIRSFSILIMSAAFIVLLAVLSVAALAFYFSTFKSDPTECKSRIDSQINNYWIAHDFAFVLLCNDQIHIQNGWTVVKNNNYSFRFILLPNHQRLSFLIAYFGL